MCPAGTPLRLLPRLLRRGAGLRRLDPCPLGRLPSTRSFSGATGSAPGVDASLSAAFDHLHNQQPEEALREFRKVLQADPNHVQALVSLALCIQSSDPEEARVLFERAMAHGAGDNPDLAGCYATFLHNTLERLPEAEEYYRRATAGPGCKEPIVFQYALLLAQLGRPDEARAQLERALQMDPSQARTQCAFATLLYRHYHSPEVAERHFKQALELDEFGYDTNLQYAQFLHTKKDLPQAEEYYTKCLALDVHDGSPALARFLFGTLGRHRAPDRFEELVADATEFPILAFCSLAQWAVDERQDYRTAERFFKKCLAIPLEDSNIDAALYVQIILRYALFCVHHMRQETAQQLVRHAAAVVPEMAPELEAQFRDLVELGTNGAPNGGAGRGP